MKKTLARKLTLNRETLGRLEGFQLKQVNGGDSNYNSCDPYTAMFCATEGCTDTCTDCSNGC